MVGTTRTEGAVGAAHDVPLVVDHIDPIAQFRRTQGRGLATLVQQTENAASRYADATLFVYEEGSGRIERHSSRAVKPALGIDHEQFVHRSADIVASGRVHLSADLKRPPQCISVSWNRSTTSRSCWPPAPSWSKGRSSLPLRARWPTPSTTWPRPQRRFTTWGRSLTRRLRAYSVPTTWGVSLVGDPKTLELLEYGAEGLPVVQLAGRAESRFDDHLTYTTENPLSIKAAIATAASRVEAALHSYVEQFNWASIADSYAETAKLTIRGT